MSLCCTCWLLPTSGACRPQCRCCALLRTVQLPATFTFCVTMMQTGTHPAVTTDKNIDRFRQQLKSLGFSYDWDREVRLSTARHSTAQRSTATHSTAVAWKRVSSFWRLRSWLAAHSLACQKRGCAKCCCAAARALLLLPLPPCCCGAPGHGPVDFPCLTAPRTALPLLSVGQHVRTQVLQVRPATDSVVSGMAAGFACAGFTPSVSTCCRGFALPPAACPSAPQTQPIP